MSKKLSRPTRLLYYEDAYLREFEAEVIQKVEVSEGEGIVLNQTAFYPGGGGQPPDRGVIYSMKGEVGIRLARMQKGTVIHVVDEASTGKLEVGDHVKGCIDWDYRFRIMRNHTSAHLMAEAVRKALGKPVEIVGSGLDASKVRLDFAYGSSTRPFFPKISDIANKIVEENRKVTVKVMERAEAEKYLEKFHESLRILPAHIKFVRIVEIEDWHACACGGTHVRSTGEIGFIKLLSRASKGKGVERIEFAAAQSP